MNTYISNFKVYDELRAKREFALDYDIFLQKIKQIFTVIHLSDDFTSYEQIEKEIIDSQCLIAFIDEYWTSSTWKMIEYSFANLGKGYNKKTNDFNIPIFISFSKPFQNKNKFLKDYNVFELSDDIENSIEFIKQKLS